MTKEDLLSDTHIVRSFNGEAVYVQMMALNKFFESNVVIPKGTNRHPYADVLHEWVEGAKMQKRYMVKDSNIQNQVRTKWIDFSLSANDEYRIKPSEPVYEWQWMYKFKNGNKFQFTGYETEDEVKHFMSTLDSDSIGHYATKIEETKRVRQ